jgi:hypothetical protein
MKRLCLLLIGVTILAAAACNEQKSTPATSGEDKVKEALDKLSPEDRALAEQQRLCPVTDEPLGSMGVPIKLTVKDKPVFICCKGCEKKVRENEDAMLTKVGELKGQPNFK